MTANVIGQSGNTIEVATLSDINGDISDLPLATSSTTGVVKIGKNLTVDTDGTIAVPEASPSTQGAIAIGTGLSISSGAISVMACANGFVGGVLLGDHVSNVGTQTFTDIAVAQTSVNTVATQLNALILALTNSGVLASS